jgi:NADH dehydrogenase
VKECSFDKENRYIDGKRGRLLANERMQSVDYQNVYLVGDVVWYMEGKRVIPQIVETALQTAETAAHNITAGIRGGEMKTFHSNYHGFMVSIGGRYGVAHVVGISLTGFLAMAAKHLINLHYLFGLAGVNAVWDYLRHHFLDVPDRRSIVGGHASARVRLYWVAVLRVFTGAMWLIEGIKKVLDGWMNPDNIFLAAAADAETAATGAVTAAADAATVATGAVTAAADVATAATAAGAQAAPYAAPLISQPTGIYTWIMDTFVAQAPFAFQVLIVAAEIGIGLALIGGLFTFAAAAASIGLCLMFILGAMASREILWYIVAAIVLLGGAGRALGLDYWVIPWLKRWWNGRTLAKRTYLYIDEPVGKK